MSDFRAGKRLLPGATQEEIQAWFLAEARTAHPDHGGDNDTWLRLVAARDAALADLHQRLTKRPNVGLPSVIEERRIQRAQATEQYADKRKLVGVLALSRRERWQRLMLITTAISGILSVLSQSDVGALRTLYKPIFASQLDMLQGNKSWLRKLLDQADSDFHEIADENTRITAVLDRFNKAKDAARTTAARQLPAASVLRPKSTAATRQIKGAPNAMATSSSIPQQVPPRDPANTGVHNEALILSTALNSEIRNIYSSLSDIYDPVRHITEDSQFDRYSQKYSLDDFAVPQFGQLVSFSYAIDLSDGRQVPLSDVATRLHDLPNDWEYRSFSGYEGGQTSETASKAAMKELGEQFTLVPDTTASIRFIQRLKTHLTRLSNDIDSEIYDLNAAVNEKLDQTALGLRALTALLLIISGQAVYKTNKLKAQLDWIDSNLGTKARVAAILRQLLDPLPEEFDTHQLVESILASTGKLMTAEEKRKSQDLVMLKSLINQAVRPIDFADLLISKGISLGILEDESSGIEDKFRIVSLAPPKASAASE